MRSAWGTDVLDRPGPVFPRIGARARIDAPRGPSGQVCLFDARTVTLLTDAGEVVQHVKDRFSPSDAPLPAGVEPVPVLRPGDRVAVSSGNGTFPGIVSKASESGRCSVVCDDGVVRPGHAGIVAASYVPLPVPPARGERIEWTERGAACHGVVVRSGYLSLTVRIDGGLREVTGPPGTFRRSDAPLPVDPPCAMDAWGIGRYREERGRIGPGVAFEATACREGRTVLRISKVPDAPASVVLAKGAPADEAERFRERVADWVAIHAATAPPDPVAAWATWRATRAPFGVLASGFLSCKDEMVSPSDAEDGAFHSTGAAP